MPPKAVKDKVTGNKSCVGRDITPLQNYAVDGLLPKGFLANMLAQSGYLSAFDAHPAFNECEFSFPSSDWFAVYVLDEDGEYFYDMSTGEAQAGKLYFKIKIENNVPSIDMSTATFTIPTELINKSPCAINDKGKCGVPAKTPGSTPRASPSATPRASPAPKALKKSPAPEIVEIPDKITEAVVEALQVGIPQTKGSIKTAVSREEAEKMDKKTMIDWMSKHMYSKDIFNCLRSSTLSEQDLNRLNELESDLGGAVPMDETDTADIEAMMASATLGPGVVEQMFRKITRESIKKDITGLPKQAKAEAVVGLCRRIGLDYQIIQTARGIRIQAPDMASLSIEDALDECAKAEAIQMRLMLNDKLLKAQGRARGMVSRPAPFKSTASQTQKLALIIDDLNELIQEGAFEDLGAAMDSAGIEVEVRGDGIYRNGKHITGEDMEDLIDETALSYIKKHNIHFGKKRSKIRSNFKLAAKKCNGKRKICMKITNLYRKTRFGSGVPPAVKAAMNDFKKRVISDLTSKETILQLKTIMFDPKIIKNPKIIKTVIPLLTEFLQAKLLKISVGFVDVINKQSGELKIQLSDELASIIKINITKSSLKVPPPFTAAAIPAATIIKMILPINKMSKEVVSYVIDKIVNSGTKILTDLTNKSTAILTNISNSSTETLNKVLFGARKCKRTKNIQSNFKCAAKKCKGTSNYRKCMKTTLRKMYRKPSFGKKRKVSKSPRKTVYRLSPTRKSPRISATSVPLRTVEKGVDGNMWIVKKTVTGVKRWVKK